MFYRLVMELATLCFLSELRLAYLEFIPIDLTQVDFQTDDNNNNFFYCRKGTAHRKLHSCEEEQH